MSAKRVSNKITKKEDIDLLLSLNEDIITFDLLMEMFGDFNGKIRFQPYDTFTVPVGAFTDGKNANKNTFDTTVGLWVYNKYMIEKDLIEVIGYIDYTISGRQLGGIDNKVSQALLEGDISNEAGKRYIMKQQFLQPFVTILSPHITEKMLTSSDEVIKKRDELAKKYEDAIKNGNTLVIDDMEKELMEFARNYLEDDPSMDSYNSNSRGNFENHYKNMFIMKGSMKDPTPGKGFNVATSNYMDGISKEDYMLLCNSLAEGPYNRGKKTEIGGYWEKLFVSAFQHVVLDEEGSDCKTKKHLEFVLDNPKDWMYSYIVEKGQLIELTSKNVDQYKDKKIKLRYSGFCESKTGICNKCMGNLSYRLGTRRIGVYLAAIPGILKNLSMKSFHDSRVMLYDIDVNKAFGE